MSQQAEQTKTRLHNIDFLKFVFALLIVLFHTKSCIEGYNLKTALPGIYHWNACVDFFFIISGFFMFRSIHKENDTFIYGIKRFLRLAPLIWFSILCFLILSLISGYHFYIENNILRCFLLSNLGFSPQTEATSTHWFVPVLFWCSIFYFYISKIFDKKYLNLIIWLIIIFSLSGYMNFKGFMTGGHTTSFYNFFNIGVLRGLFGIGIGYFINMLYNTDFLTNCSKKLKLGISCFEIFLVSFFTYYLVFTEKLPSGSAFCYIFIFSLIFFLFLRKQGIVSNILNQKFFSTLGNYSYAIYIMHSVVIAYLKYLFLNSHLTLVQQYPLLYITTILVISVIIGGFTYNLIEKKLNSKLITKIK